MHPFQCSNEVIPAGVPGVFIFFPVRGEVQIPEQVQPVIDCHHHNVPVQGHGVPVIGDVFNGRPGGIPAAVHPEHDGTACPVQSGCPDIEVQAILALQPVAVRNIDFTLGFLLTEQRADIAVTRGVQDVLMLFSGLGRVKTACLCVGNPAEGQDPVVLKPADRAFRGLCNGKGAVIRKGMHGSSFFCPACRRAGG